MEVRLKPETESCLNELSSKSGRPTDALVEEALAGYLAEVSQVRNLLDSRYDDLKAGRIKPLDGDEAFERLRRSTKDSGRR